MTDHKHNWTWIGESPAKGRNGAYWCMGVNGCGAQADDANDELMARVHEWATYADDLLRENERLKREVRLLQRRVSLLEPFAPDAKKDTRDSDVLPAGASRHG